MSRRLMASVFFGIGLLAVSALGQPPAESKKPAEKKVEKKANPVDALIAAALANDPDVRMAQAKLQLADAELAKARQAVAVKVITLSASIEEQKRQVAATEDRVAWTARMIEKGFATESQLLADRQALESAKAKLSQLETELKLMTGGGPGAVGLKAPDDEIHRVAGPMMCAMCHASGTSALAWPPNHPVTEKGLATLAKALSSRLAKESSATGPIADRLRAALDKPVKLGPKDAKVTFEQAMEIFKKEAGLDVPIRGKFPPPTAIKDSPSPEIVSQGETLPVGAWIQMFEDWGDYPVSRGSTRGYKFYVRDYGLLIASRDTAPPDALTVTQFWKQKFAK